MQVKTKPRILFYDLETTPLLAWVWGCGDQYISPGQLHEDRDLWDIICVTYCYNDGKPAKHLDFGYEEQDSKQMLIEFSKLVEEADIVIGKNSDRFDNKMINSMLAFRHGLPGLGDWVKYTDDLEKHLRKHFRLPSQGLDYVSHKLGCGGKIKMQMSDWIDIVTKHPTRGRKAFDKMIKYGKKDILDTRAVWNYCEEYFQPKHNASIILTADGNPATLGCRSCGSERLHKKDTRIQGNTVYQRYRCGDCGKYAGRAPISSKPPTKLR